MTPLQHDIIRALYVASDQEKFLSIPAITFLMQNGGNQNFKELNQAARTLVAEGLLEQRRIQSRPGINTRNPGFRLSTTMREALDRQVKA